MSIHLIHGFIKEKQKIVPEWGSISVSETVLVEMVSAESNALDVLAALPAAPNTISATNPKGISFTFDLSEHPESSALILRTAGDVRISAEGVPFWEVELNYSNKSFYQLTGPAVVNGGHGSSRNPTSRKDQREELNPPDRRVVWSTSSAIVQKETFRHATTNNPIRHTNGLPITTPFKYSEVHETHTFSYNVDYSSFNYSVYDGYIGKVNSSSCLGKPAGTLKLSAFSANEEYESNGSGINKVEYHYVRVTISFEYNPSGWDEEAKLVSMSTKQLKLMLVAPFAAYYDNIPISATQYAEDPWPLDANGLAIPYDDNDPADYGYVDHGYPRTADLTNITGIKSLSIP